MRELDPLFTADRTRPSAPILVTGGTHGIGRATVERLRKIGRNVAFCGRDEATGRAVAAATGAHFIACDVGDDAGIEHVIETVLANSEGGLAGLVNNAGISLRRTTTESTLADWDHVMAINARSAFAFTSLCLDALRRAHGSIVMVSSVAGWVGQAELAIYSASKGALLSLSASIAVELGAELRCNVVCPGQIGTRMMATAIADPARRQAIESAIPARRFGVPNDVAGAICWLLSDDSSFVNGAVLVVDGGETAGIA